MKLIIAGSRYLADPYPYIRSAILKQYDLYSHNLIIVTGNSGSVDLAGNEFANRHKLELVTFPPDWKTHGKAAGPIRNKQMAEYADALLLIWDGESKGSSNMKNEMIKLNKPIYEIRISKYNQRK